MAYICTQCNQAEIRSFVPLQKTIMQDDCSSIRLECRSELEESDSIDQVGIVSLSEACVLDKSSQIFSGVVRVQQESSTSGLAAEVASLALITPVTPQGINLSS